MKKTIILLTISAFLLAFITPSTNAQQTNYCDTPWNLLPKDTRDIIQPIIQYFGVRFGWMTYSYMAEGITGIIASPEYPNGADMKYNLYAFCLPSNSLVNDSEIKIRQALEKGIQTAETNKPGEGAKLWSIVNQICAYCQDPSNSSLKNSLKTIAESSEIQEATSPTGSYERLGRESYKALLELKKDSSCQADLNVGLLDFFHNPLSWFLRVIFWLFEQLLEILADIFMWVLTPKNFGGFVNFAPVQTIWKTARDLANIGIILGFVFVAIATILKIEKYSWDKMLWRLVLVALLINFSLVLCGIFVDLSNFLTTYFVTGAGSQVFRFKDILVNTASSIACAGYNQGFLYESGSALIGIIVVVIFLGQVAGLIFYAVIRVVTLWITLGLSPLFLLSLAFPGLEKLADNWKNYFTQAIVSLPVIAFSLFIVLVMLNEVALNFEFAKGDFGKTIISLVSFGIIIIILSQAILAIAGALGIQNIKQGYKIVTKLTWGALGLAGGYIAGRTAQNLVSSESWRKTAELFEKVGFKPVHDLGERMKQITDKTVEGTLKMLEAKAKKMTDDQIRLEAKNYMRWGRRREVGVLLNELATRHKISDGNPEDKNDIKNIDDKALAFAKNYVDVSKIKETNPYLYVKHFSKEEDREQKRKEIKSQYAKEGKEISDEELEQKVNNELLIKLAGESSPDKLIAGRWQEIFKNIEKAQGREVLLDILNRLTESLTPEAMAAIARSHDPKEQYIFINNLIEANKEKAKQAGLSSAAEYLLENKKYKTLRYFEGVIKK